MRNKRFYLNIVVGCAVLCIAAAFIPVKDYLPHPKTATVQFDSGLEVPVILSVRWYDQGLNTNGFGKSVEFDANRQTQISDTAIPTRLWRLVLKRVLTPFDKWTACENCYGPNVTYSLKLKDDYHPPEKMRLVQNRSEQGDKITFRVSLIPNEAKYETREFHPNNLDALLNEVKKIVSEGSANNIPSSKWGSELSKLNPVRVECRDSALVIWMGGKIGYVIVPDSTSCPAFNMGFVSGTEYSHVFKLEKM